MENQPGDQRERKERAMLDDVRTRVRTSLANSWLNYGASLTWARMTAELNDIELKTSQPDFWKDTGSRQINRAKLR